MTLALPGTVVDLIDRQLRTRCMAELGPVLSHQDYVRLAADFAEVMS